MAKAKKDDRNAMPALPKGFGFKKVDYGTRWVTIIEERQAIAPEDATDEAPARPYNPEFAVEIRFVGDQAESDAYRQTAVAASLGKRTDEQLADVMERDSATWARRAFAGHWRGATPANLNETLDDAENPIGFDRSEFDPEQADSIEREGMPFDRDFAVYLFVKAPAARFATPVREAAAEFREDAKKRAAEGNAGSST